MFSLFNTVVILCVQGEKGQVEMPVYDTPLTKVAMSCSSRFNFIHSCRERYCYIAILSVCLSETLRCCARTAKRIKISFTALYSNHSNFLTSKRRHKILQ